MNEDNVLEELFESARNEGPRMSFEEVAEGLAVGISAIGIAYLIRDFLINKISLNSIIMISTTTLLTTAAWIALSPSDEQVIDKQPIIKEAIVVVDSITDKTVISTKKIEFDMELDEKHFGSLPDKYSPNLELIKPQAHLEISSTPKALAPVNDNIDSPDESYPVEDALIVQFERFPAPGSPVVLGEENDPDTALVAMEEVFSFASCQEEVTMEYFKKFLEDQGLVVDLNWKYSNRKKMIKNFKLKLQYNDELDMKMKVEGFCKFAILCGLNEESQIVQLRFKVDDHEYEEINLRGQGSSYHYRSSKN